MSLHDLRTAGIKAPPEYAGERFDNDGLVFSSMFSLKFAHQLPTSMCCSNVVATQTVQWTAQDHQLHRLGASGQARSEPKIDSDVRLSLPSAVLEVELPVSVVGPSIRRSGTARLPGHGQWRTAFHEEVRQRRHQPSSLYASSLSPRQRISPGGEHFLFLFSPLLPNLAAALLGEMWHFVERGCFWFRSCIAAAVGKW